jgi:hypothetical protein
MIRLAGSLESCHSEASCPKATKRAWDSQAKPVRPFSERSQRLSDWISSYANVFRISELFRLHAQFIGRIAQHNQPREKAPGRPESPKVAWDTLMVPLAHKNVQ